MLWSVHPRPSGDEGLACVCVHACMHACVLVFVSASGNVLLCASACSCVVLLKENSLERASQTSKCCQDPEHSNSNHHY